MSNTVTWIVWAAALASVVGLLGVIAYALLGIRDAIERWLP